MIFKAIRTGQIKIISHSQHDKKSSKVDQSYSLKLLEEDTIIFHQSFLDLSEQQKSCREKKKPPLTEGG
jgi:hypothetical protein